MSLDRRGKDLASWAVVTAPQLSREELRDKHRGTEWRTGREPLPPALEAQIHLHARDGTVQLPAGIEKRKEVRKEWRVQSRGLILPGQATWSGKKDTQSL